MNIAYIRVSTIEQNTERQERAIKKEAEMDKIFIEKVSAKDMNRPELKKMLDYVRKGDKIYIKDFSRLARSTKDLLEIIEYLEHKGVSLISLNERLDTSSTTGKLLVTMIGAINEFERNNLLERQREGIKIAKEQGKYKGKPKKKIDKKRFKELYKEVQEGNKTNEEMAKELGISIATLYRRLKEYRAK